MWSPPKGDPLWRPPPTSGTVIPMATTNTHDQRDPGGPEGLAIRVTGLTKRFGERVAIDGIELTVPRGCAFGFLGPNGAGKTTMIRMLLGLTRASAGSMQLLGLPVPAQRAQALQRVGAIVEEPRFHPHLTGRENLRLIAAARGPQARPRIAPALARAGLSERADEKVKRYSLGMRQRLGVARCLLADPLLLILDEPTNGLDPGGIQEFRLMIRELVEQEGRTVFLSSHLLDEVEKICDTVAIVDRGKVVVQGPTAELASGGSRHELIVGVDDPDRALEVLGAPAARVGGAFPDSSPGGGPAGAGPAGGDPAGGDPTAVGPVGEAHRSDEGLRVVLAAGPEGSTVEAQAAEVNAQLVRAGIGVSRLEPVRHSLEQRFLEITSRLDAPVNEHQEVTT
jgi:ABC-2 type transport system ATP-binding protein